MTDHTPDVPALQGMMPFVHNVDEAPAYWWQDILWVILVNGDNTGGRYSLMPQTMPKHAGARRTSTPGRTSISTSSRADITFLIGEDMIEGHAGDFVWIPRNTRHAFRVDSDEAVILNGYTPSGAGAVDHRQGNARDDAHHSAQGRDVAPAPTAAEMRLWGMDGAPGPNPFAKG